MTIALALALYAVIWWIVLFAVLPWGVRTQGEAGEVVPGTPASAPVAPGLRRAFLVTTLVAAVVFGIVWTTMAYDLLGLYARFPSSPVP